MSLVTVIAALVGAKEWPLSGTRNNLSSVFLITFSRKLLVQVAALYCADICVRQKVLMQLCLPLNLTWTFLTSGKSTKLRLRPESFLDPKIDIFIFIVTNVHIVIRNEKAKQVLKLFSGACATVSDPLIKKKRYKRTTALEGKNKTMR